MQTDTLTSDIIENLLKLEKENFEQTIALNLEKLKKFDLIKSDADKSDFRKYLLINFR